MDEANVPSPVFATLQAFKSSSPAYAQLARKDTFIRTITHAFHFDFPAGELPKARAADDAEQVRWIPVSEAMLMQEKMFEDHFHILEHFLGGA